jgi:hypothetical protein
MNQARGTKLGLRYLRAGAQPLSHFLSNAITLLRYKATVLLHSYFVLLPIAIRATLRIANTHSRGRPARGFSYLLLLLFRATVSIRLHSRGRVRTVLNALFHLTYSS